MRGVRCKTCPSPLRPLIDQWLIEGHTIACISWHLLRVDHRLPSTSLETHCEVHLGLPIPPWVGHESDWHYTPYTPAHVLSPMQPELLLVRGLPGVGKTQVARQYAATHAHMETDFFFADTYGRVDRIYPHKFPEAHTWCQNWTSILLQMGHNVVVANTFITQASMAWYFREAVELGSPVRVIEVPEGLSHTRSGKLQMRMPYLRRDWEPCPIPVEVVARPLPDAQMAASVRYQCQAGVCSLETT